MGPAREAGDVVHLPLAQHAPCLTTTRQSSRGPGGRGPEPCAMTLAPKAPMVLHRPCSGCSLFRAAAQGDRPLFCFPICLGFRGSRVSFQLSNPSPGFSQACVLIRSDLLLDFPGLLSPLYAHHRGSYCLAPCERPSPAPASPSATPSTTPNSTPISGAGPGD